MLNPSQEYTFGIFSDDGVLAIRLEDGSVKRFEIDISKCDRSHATIFKAFRESCPTRLLNYLDRLIEQCLLPITIRSTGSRAKVKLRPMHPYLPSGSTITTILNNFALFCICSQIAQDHARTVKDIITSAEKVGYIVKVEEKPFEELMFLKHRPVVTSDGVQAILALGVFLRAAGCIRGDLPGKGPLRERALPYLSQVIKCSYPDTHSPFLDKLRSNNAVDVIPECIRKHVEARFAYKTSSSVPVRLTDAQLLGAYKLTPLELAGVYSYAHSAQVFTEHANRGLERILQMDYGCPLLYDRGAQPIGVADRF